MSELFNKMRKSDDRLADADALWEIISSEIFYREELAGVDIFTERDILDLQKQVTDFIVNLD